MVTVACCMVQIEPCSAQVTSASSCRSCRFTSMTCSRLRRTSPRAAACAPIPKAARHTHAERRPPTAGSKGGGPQAVTRHAARTREQTAHAARAVRSAAAQRERSRAGAQRRVRVPEPAARADQAGVPVCAHSGGRNRRRAASELVATRDGRRAARNACVATLGDARCMRLPGLL